MSNQEKYEQIAQQILKQLGDNPGKWQAQWHKLGSAQNLDRRAYTGVNSFSLAFNDYDSPFYGTYKALQAKDLQVQKGQKGHSVIYWTMIQKKDSDDVFPFMRIYKIFNIDQCGTKCIDKECIATHPKDKDDKPIELTPTCKLTNKTQFEFTDKLLNADSRIPELDKWINSHDVPISHGGDRAYYRPSTHEIQLPKFENFLSPTNYYSTAFHELVHSTGKALDRDHTGTFGDPSYALEELVAESGSAILCQEHNLTPEIRPDHAQYIASWIKALKNEPQAFVKAFSQATKAVKHLMHEEEKEVKDVA